MKNLEIQVRYEGQLEEIRADILLPSLLGYINLLEELNREFNTNKKLNIYIKSTGTGSFLVDLNLILDAIDKIKSLFGNDLSQEAIKGILQAAATLIAIKVFLKGEKPQEVKEKGDFVVLVNGNNNEIKIDKSIYEIAKSNEIVDEAISHMAEPVENDDKISGISIQEKRSNKTFVKISKSDIEYIKKPNPLLEEKIRTITKEKQLLTVLKVVFAQNRKWEFIYDGNKISAHIRDEEFLSRLNDYSFTMGTKMICDLEIIQVFDRKISDFINREYEIIKVYKVIPPNTNKELF